MGNITTYLKWRGDLTFEERPFCYVDNVILSELSYLHFDGIVPGVGDDNSLRLGDAMAQFLRSDEKMSGLDENKQEFAKAIASSRRFGDLKLRNYIDLYHIEGTETDFSAIEICLSDTEIYTAFRGTGGALLGWREDFSMCYQTMPAQRYAVQYLHDTYDSAVEKYIFGGHSKGGNIALYAAVNCEEAQRDKLVTIYSNDGPGLCEDIVDPEKVKEVQGRLVRIVPEFSIIGALFETEAKTIIVNSDVEGIMQHDLLTWEVEGDEFVTCEKHSSKCLFYNDVLRTWIENADMEQREGFTKNLFDALEANGTTQLADVSGNGADDFLVILISLTQSDKKTRNVMLNFGRIFAESVRNVHFSVFVRQKATIEALIVILIGMCASLFTDYAVYCAGVAGGILACVYLGKRILETAFAETGTVSSRKMKVVILLLAMCVLMYLVAERDILYRITNLLIAIGFLIFSYYWLTRSFTYERIFPNRVLGLFTAAIFFIMGTVPIIARGIEMSIYMMGAGGVIWFYGMGMLIYQAYLSGKENRKTY